MRMLFLCIIAAVLRQSMGEGLAHQGEDCWIDCGQKEGPCEWCGSAGMCCQQGVLRDGCDGSIGGPIRDGKHACDAYGTTSLVVFKQVLSARPLIRVSTATAFSPEYSSHYLQTAVDGDVHVDDSRQYTGPLPILIPPQFTAWEPFVPEVCAIMRLIYWENSSFI